MFNILMSALGLICTIGLVVCFWYAMIEAQNQAAQENRARLRWKCRTFDNKENDND